VVGRRRIRRLDSGVDTTFWAQDLLDEVTDRVRLGVLGERWSTSQGEGETKGYGRGEDLAAHESSRGSGADEGFGYDQINDSVHTKVTPREVD
jgi:hypothetical protein